MQAVHSAQSAHELSTTLVAAGCELVPLSTNLVDQTWGTARPAPPDAPMRIHPIEYAGETVADKVSLRDDVAVEILSVRSCLSVFSVKNMP